MNLLKLLGIAGVAGAGIGIYVSGVIKDKFGIGGGSNTKNAPKSKVEVIRIDENDELVKAQVFVKAKAPKEEG